LNEVVREHVRHNRGVGLASRLVELFVQGNQFLFNRTSGRTRPGLSLSASGQEQNDSAHRSRQTLGHLVSSIRVAYTVALLETLGIRPRRER
jgi:hypothetical protein